MKDTIWNWFAFWGPVARDVLSIVLASLGAYLALRAIQMGKEQTATSKRQAEIAELQHRIQVEQLERKPDVVIQTNVSRFASGNRYFQLLFLNKGTKTVEGIEWVMLYTESETLKQLSFNIPTQKDDRIPGERASSLMRVVQARYEQALYTNYPVVIAGCELPADHVDGSIHINCYAVWDGGRWPADGSHTLLI